MPGLLLAKLICPVPAVTLRPLGLELKVPPLAPGPNNGLGLAAVLQKLVVPPA